MTVLPINRVLLLMFAIVVFANCSDNNPVNGDRATAEASVESGVPASNLAMAAELKSIADNVPPDQTWNSNSVAAEYYRNLMEQAQGQARVQYRFKYADQLLNAGKTSRAITEFTGVIQDLQQLGAGLNNDTKQVYEMLAIAYMRLGEEENCTGLHNENSCFIPIAPEAVHTMRAGSENAINIYTMILQQWPDDLQSRYLLNLAYMTLGDYPDKVPSQFLIKDLGKPSGKSTVRPFRDVAIQSKTDILGLSGGICFDDFNNDNLIDIVASSWGLRDPVRYLTNNGDGTYTDISIAAGLQGITSGLNTIQADYNNDGFLDILILRGAWLGHAGKHPNSLLRNNGDNTFTDVTRESGIYSLFPTQSAVWADFNLDGWVDLFIGNESTPKYMAPCELFINNGDGTFREVAVQARANFQAFFKGAASADINNDGWPDLYLSSLSGPNVMLLNRGAGADGIPQFEDISAKSGATYPLQSFPCWFWDYDQDGWEDIFVSSYDVALFKNLAGEFSAEVIGNSITLELPRLYRNNGNLTFTDETSKAGLDKVMSAMGSNYGDLDNDGYFDFYVGNGAPDFRMVIPNRMFQNKGGKHFDEITYDSGFGHIQKGHGVAFADCDNDGDQDIYCVMGGAAEGDTYFNLLFENPGSSNSWLTLLLEGTQSNRSAIGARIIVTGKSKSGATIKRHIKVTTGGSFGASSLRVEAGLGDMQTIDHVEVNWPNKLKTKEVFDQVEINSTYKIVEGSGKAQKITLPTFRFSDPV